MSRNDTIAPVTHYAVNGREAFKSCLNKILFLLCMGLFASSCSSDTAMKQGEQAMTAGEPENLPEMAWYPRPKGAVPDVRYPRGYPVPQTQAIPYPGYAPNAGMPAQGAVSQSWPGRFQDYPQTVYERQPDQIWQAPGQAPSASAQGYVPQPVMPRYIQRPWGETAVPNSTFNSGSGQWQQGFQAPAAGYPGHQQNYSQYQQPYPAPQQDSSRQVNPWGGSQEWRTYQYDVSPSRSPGYVW